MTLKRVNVFTTTPGGPIPNPGPDAANFIYDISSNNIDVITNGGVSRKLIEPSSSSNGSINSEYIVFVGSKSDFPSAINGIITLLGNVTYFITTTIDLTGDRIVCGENTTILGGSSENCRLKSTGLSGNALISSIYSLPIRNITLEASIAINLSATGSDKALDWFGVNFTDCATIGTIENYANFIMIYSAFLNSGNLTFNGNIGTIGLLSCLFNTGTNQTAFILSETLTISRRIRIAYSSFIILPGETALNVSLLATIPLEGYILDTLNFSGEGTYINGVEQSSNKSLFVNCVGIKNTSVNGQLYMNDNVTTTTISNTNTFYKILGTTTPSDENSRYIHTNNRLTCNASIARKYLIQCTLSFNSGNANVCQFGFYDSKLGIIRNPSKTKSTSNSAGRAENVSFFCVVDHSFGDFVEIHCANTSAATNITVTDMNFILTEIK